MHRRAFLKSGGVALFGTGSVPAWLGRAVAGSVPRRKVLVVVFQRGAADALNMVVPHAEPAYYRYRPSIAVPRERVLDLDGQFGFHPMMAPLAPLFRERQLAVVHAVGSPDPTRSHFDAQDYMESGTPGRKSTPGGWLNRALAQQPDPSPLRAVSLGATVARTLRGDQGAVALGSIEGFALRDAEAARGFEARYAEAFDRPVQNAAKDMFAAARLIERVRQNPSPVPAGVAYPAAPLGRGLREIASLIKADLGLEAAFADIGGWDHHANEVGASIEEGLLAGRLREFSQSLVAFFQDLGDRMADTVLVTMTEFGRTARENGNRGTDHGHGGVMLVAGGGVRGGKVHGRWPGLEREQLFEQRDLAVTTDYREVLSNVLTAQGWASARTVFPGWKAGIPPAAALQLF